jgi:hypothetical protein
MQETDVCTIPDMKACEVFPLFLNKMSIADISIES